jgi:hypothetical protein
MSQKLLEAMRANPNGWSIDDVKALCSTVEARCRAPKRGTHYKVSHPSQQDILTIPANRPIKPVYIRKLVQFVGLVMAEGSEE